MTRRTVGDAVLRTLLVVLFVYGPFVGIHAICLTGHVWTHPPGVELFRLVPLAALLGLPIAAACLASTRLRAKAANVVLAMVALIVLFIPAARTGGAIRMYGFVLAAQRAAPLVAAIERYCRENRDPPMSTSELVPRYLPAIPDGLPPLRLISGIDAKEHYRGNEWVLVASVSSGFINFDKFMYFPNGDYPDHGYGGSIERVAGWAYVHE